MTKSLLAASLALLLLCACSGGGRRDAAQEVNTYLKDYEQKYQKLSYESSLAEWESNTHIVEGDKTNLERTKRANEALAKFVGSVENIEKIKEFLSHRDQLTPMQVRQLDAMLYKAANQPQTVADVVRDRIAAEAEQNEKLYGFTFHLNAKAITPNEIDQRLRTSSNLTDRRAVWESSKEVGPALKPGLTRLRDLRNQTVRALGYPDFFTYQVSDYGMKTDEMLRLSDKLIEQLRPLYRELHTWTRYELARRYKVPAPALIPAHWLPNRWAQDWSNLVTVSNLSIDEPLKGKTPEWVVKQGEAFYVSLGFDPLPATFWEKSSLYPVAADSPFKKNTHASAWHLDLDHDVRSLMSVETNRDWYETVHHELGHIYYFMSYSRPEIPIVLREGANRAYHEGLGTMMGLASLKPKFLINRKLVPADTKVDLVPRLLQEALNYAVFIPFSAGTMTRFEHALYAENLSPDQFNAKWWEFARRYQGVEPPAERGEQFADGLTKTHINDDPGQYYDYALSNALLFQIHDHIARKILNQDPYDCDYYGSHEVGNFLRNLMQPGASRPWREVLRETTGQELDAQAMVDYFKPLYDWLVEQNRGRQHTLQ